MRRRGAGSIVAGIGVVAMALTGCTGETLGDRVRTPHPITSDAVEVEVTRILPTVGWNGEVLELTLRVVNGSGEPLWMPAGDVVVVADPDHADGVLLVQRIPDQEVLDSTNFGEDPGDATARRLDVGGTELTEEVIVPLVANERWGGRGEWSRGAPEQIARIRFCLAVVPEEAVAAHDLDVDATFLTYPWQSGWWADEASLACSESVELSTPVALDW